MWTLPQHAKDALHRACVQEPKENGETRDSAVSQGIQVHQDKMDQKERQGRRECLEPKEISEMSEPREPVEIVVFLDLLDTQVFKDSMDCQD